MPDEPWLVVCSQPRTNKQTNKNQNNQPKDVRMAQFSARFRAFASGGIRLIVKVSYNPDS